MLRPRVFAFAVLVLPAFAVARVAAQSAHYHVVKRMPLGHISADYIVVDPVGRRLYGIGDKVIDVDKDVVVGTVAGGGGGYAIAADQNRGLVRNGVLFDLKTLAVTGHLDIKADGILYDPFTHHAFAWEGKDTWVVDMISGKLITKTTSVGEGLESGASDRKGKLFINVEEAGAVEGVDAAALKIESTHKVTGCGRAQGLSMDRATRRLFMACDKEMVVVNADNGSVVTRIPVPSRADQNAFDPGTKLAFNANRADSTMTVVHEDSPDTYSVVEKVPTGGGARTCAVDEKTHKVYAFYMDGASRETAQLVLLVLAP